MKWFLASVLVVAVMAIPDESHYDSKYDDFEIKDIISNLRLLKSYVHCFTGDGKCTAEGKTFKELLPEVVNSKCAKCTDKQKVIIAKLMKATREKVPNEFQKLQHIHDPEGKGTEEVNAFIAKYDT